MHSCLPVTMPKCVAMSPQRRRAARAARSRQRSYQDDALVAEKGIVHGRHTQMLVTLPAPPACSFAGLQHQVESVLKKADSGADHMGIVGARLGSILRAPAALGQCGVRFRTRALTHIWRGGYRPRTRSGSRSGVGRSPSSAAGSAPRSGAPSPRPAQNSLGVSTWLMPDRLRIGAT